MDRREFWQICAAGLVGGDSQFPLARQQPGDPTPLQLTMERRRILRLYGAQAARLEKVRYVGLPAVMVWSEADGTVTWQLESLGPGDYEVSICYAAAMEGWQVEVFSPSSGVTATVNKTEGFYWDNRFNFERVVLTGMMSFPPGSVALSLRAREAVSYEVPDYFWTKPRPTFLLRSVELTPVAAKTEIVGRWERARKRRASAAWLSEAIYGVMFHWNSRSAPRHGPRRSYLDAVQSFDVEAFVDMVRHTGGGYVLLTTGWADPCCPAPIQSWERVFPGWTARRDLIADLAEGLAKKGIRLLLYFPSQTLGWSEDYQRLEQVSADEFTHIHSEILDEVGHRYGESVAGYWFDGWGLVTVKYPNISTEEFFNFCKVGNADRIIALSNWIFPLENPWQDYYAGDLGSIENPPRIRYVENGPGEGIQYHCTVTLDEPNWAHEAIESPMAGPRFDDKRLVSYVQSCMGIKVPVTLNLGVFQDGTVGEHTLKQVRSLRRRIRGD